MRTRRHSVKPTGTKPEPTDERLRAIEESFRLLVGNVLDYAIFMLDPDGRVVSWNAGAERLKGYREEEILGQSFARFYPREDVERGDARRLAPVRCVGVVQSLHRPLELRERL